MDIEYTAVLTNPSMTHMSIIAKIEIRLCVEL